MEGGRPHLHPFPRPRHLSEAPLPITSSLSRYHLPEITYFILYYFLVIVSIVSFCPYNRSGWLHSSRRFAPPPFTHCP